VVYVGAGPLEAPNWTKDNMLVFNGDGRLRRIPANGGRWRPSTTESHRVNNDHVLSPDGNDDGISRQSQRKKRQSLILCGADRRRDPAQVRRNRLRICNGWSRTGKTLAFCGDRTALDVYTIPAAAAKRRG